MQNKETTTILDQYNNENGIVHVITESLNHSFATIPLMASTVKTSKSAILTTSKRSLLTANSIFWIPKNYCHIEIRFSPRSWK